MLEECVCVCVSVEGRCDQGGAGLLSFIIEVLWWQLLSAEGTVEPDH